ncbi:MAG: peptide chain release factor 1, partial [Planctomycetota bacterium]
SRLESVEARSRELEATVTDPEMQKDRARFQGILKEHGSTSALVALYREYLKAETDLEEARQLASGEDPELRELAASELDHLEEARARAAREIRILLLDQEVVEGDDVIIEIRAGTGGEEAALFSADIFRMYSLFADRMRWKVEILDESPTPLGGYKEMIFSVRGKGAYRRLRFESGGHRVQRVPETEAQGRIHTSAITVAVMAEVEESEIEINEADLRIDTFCASGPGGQKVNKTSSAVRMTHIPTGIVVSIQDEKSQHKNRAKALRVLRSRLREKEERERRAKEAALRRSLIGTGDQSDRIRTYNFPQNRVTDHRIGYSFHSLDRFILGDLEDFLNKLEAHDREQRVQFLG